MQNLQTFNPTDYTSAITGIIYYGLIIIAAFISAMTIYVLIKNGKSRILGFIVSVVYIVFFFGLIAQGTGLLSLIK